MYAEPAPGSPQGKRRSVVSRALPVLVVLVVAVGLVGACRLWVQTWDPGYGVSLGSSTCLDRLTAGLVSNRGDQTVDVTLEIEFWDQELVLIDGSTWTARIEPGDTVRWEYRPSVREWRRCGVRIASVSEPSPSPTPTARRGGGSGD